MLFKILILGATIGWTSMKWSNSIEETKIVSNGENVILFLNKSESSE